MSAAEGLIGVAGTVLIAGVLYRVLEDGTLKRIGPAKSRARPRRPARRRSRAKPKRRKRRKPKKKVGLLGD